MQTRRALPRAGAAAEELTTLRAELRAAKRMVENYERDMDRVAEELETNRGAIAQADRKVSVHIMDA
jgi:predicted  nucleic acid-binding Zn-ribbon protein